jgi:uncharacterized glyoxalase superfamily protein PhnB
VEGIRRRRDTARRLAWRPSPTGGGSVYVVVDDPDGHYERAKAAGVKIRRELRDEDYGSRGYSAEDPEGNVWSFGTYRP